jgi:hypothetical protein
MYVGKSSWDYSGGQVGSQQATKVPHGANTTIAINFCYVFFTSI